MWLKDNYIFAFFFAQRKARSPRSKWKFFSLL